MRAAALVRAAYGASLLAAPGAVVRTVSGKPADGPSAIVARVLGARHIAQAATVGRSERRLLLAAGAATDGLHALSMVALAAFDAVVASLFMLSGTLEVRRA